MSCFLLVSGDFVQTGGMDISNYNLARYLAQADAEVHLVSHRVQPDLAAMPNVHVHLAPKPLNSYLLGERLLDRLGRSWAGRLAQRKVRVIVNGGNCDWGDVNWVHYVHAVYEPKIQSRSWLRAAKLRVDHYVNKRRERRIIGHAKAIVANSERTRRDLIIHLGAPADRIHTVYYGTDPQQFQPASVWERRQARAELRLPRDTKLALFVGALGDRRKGFGVVFRAFEQLAAEPRWNSDLVVVGQGAELPFWKKRAAAAGLQNRVHFLGFRQDVPKIMASCDCLVSPTRYEAYGLAVREALCSALPAFVTSSSGVAEEYPTDLRRGLLLNDFDDPGELAGRLYEWCQNVPEYRRRVMALSARLRRWTWDHMSASIVKLVSESN